MPDDPIDSDPIDDDAIDDDAIADDPVGGDPIDGPFDGDPIDADAIDDPIASDPPDLDGDDPITATPGAAEPPDAAGALPDDVDALADPIGLDEGETDHLLSDPEPAATSGDGEVAVLAELSSIVGSDAEALYAFGQSAGETAIVGIESVANHRAAFGGVAAHIEEFSQLSADYAGVPHLGFELRIALDEAEIYTAMLIARLEDVGALLSIETSPEQMADGAFAAGQIEVLGGSLREFLDLAGLMLFSDELAGAEATLGEIRLNAIEETVTALADAAGEPIGLRIDFNVALPEGGAARMTLAAPAGLVARLAALSAASGGDVEEAPGAPPPPEIGGLPDFDLPAMPAAASAAAPADDVAVHPVRFPALGPSDPRTALPSSIDMILDISLRVTVELGRSSLTVQEILALGPGSVVELNKLAGEPVDILINDRPIARGEVVVVDENFGVRVTEVLSPRSRIEAVGR